jgi:chromosomal replication initiation ATPase DnaA
MTIHPVIYVGLADQRPTIQMILNSVAKAFDLSDVSDMFQKNRKRAIVEARQSAMYIIRKQYPEKPYSKIASIFNKDHATVIHAIKTVENFICTDKTFRDKLNNVIGYNSDCIEKIMDKKADIYDRSTVARIY